MAIWIGAKRRGRGWSGALLAGVLLAHSAAVGNAGTPNANSWSTVALSGDVPGALFDHGVAAAGLLMYVFGGHDGTTRASCDGIITSAVCSGCANCGAPRTCRKNVPTFWYGVEECRCEWITCFEPNNRLTEIDTTNGVCTRLDAAAGVTGAPPVPRRSMGFAALDGVLYVFAGRTYVDGVHAYANDLHAYTIATRAWRQLDATAGVTGAFPSVRDRMGFSAGPGGLLVTFGVGKNPYYPRDVHFFNTAAMAWSELQTPPAKYEKGGLVQSSYRYNHGHAVLDGTLYVFGGKYGTLGGRDSNKGWKPWGYFDDLLALPLGDPASQWSVVAAQAHIPGQSSGPYASYRRGWSKGALAVLGKRLVIFGGTTFMNVNGSYLDTAASFDSGVSGWAEMSSMPTGRYGFGNVAVVGKTAYLYGGCGTPHSPLV